jgi:hypothetical protein
MATGKELADMNLRGLPARGLIGFVGDDDLTVTSAA